MRSLVAIACWLWVAIGGAVFAAHGCATRAGDPTTLQILGAAIDPAYSVAMDGCITEQETLVGQAEDQVITVGEARALIAAIRERCHHARATFEALRAIHGAAVQALEHGDQSEADRITAELEQAWKGLRNHDGG